MSTIEKEAPIVWWESLQEDNGGRATLKRSKTLESSALHPQTIALKRVYPWMSIEALATLASLATFLKRATPSDDSETFGKIMAKPSTPGGRPPISELRFKQLLAARDWDELFRLLRRIVAVIDGGVAFTTMADVISKWDQELRGAPKAPGKTLKYKLSEAYYVELLNLKM